MQLRYLKRFLLIGGVVVGSCTDLDENNVLYDTATSTNFYQTDREILSAVGAAYANLFGSFGNADNIMPLCEVTTDEMVVPTRGADWGDGGHWVRLQTHTYNSQDPRPLNTWNFLYAGVNTCNRLLATLEPIGTEQANAFIAELKALRAIYYYWLLDLFGNVPLSTDFSNTEPPANSTRQQVYDFVEKELLDNAPLLQKTGPADESTYGRVNYYTAYTALAKLYLNAEVYTGTPQWDKAIAACDEVINSGMYSLMPNYRDNFTRNNKGSTEFIWVIPYDEINATGHTIPHITLHMQSQNTYQMSAQPWNGFASIQEFYQSYTDPTQNPGPQGEVIGVDPAGTPTTGTLDNRLSNFIVGPQFEADGSTPLQDGGADPNDPNGPPITFTPYINELLPSAWRQSGARIGKWEIYKGNNGQLSNDYCIFRYADVILMKAEAVARQSGNWNDPVTLAIVNQIREEHGKVDPFQTLDAEGFLAERGREMFAESVRRTDLIRFGKYNDAWRFHDADPADNLGPNGINHLNIFPIPETQINANRNLKQNPGY
ncbi:Starch-binding associating with outer membrane [Catalinimonas alkaloidigena]|uniref:Starch-binding associating with outer membrane n=1 Tax=Catalinimonas alkaloidigena TaxID=1075417 RepID=A0A1G9KHX5_9BACT|nr:RagB/SusD family nutrient uptake outer membrane protein [Catalinimonas alkaloidigena]SDL49144.1 Starch-binding associating with outer membrane [Catalinimonas alkaloidigena]